MNKQKPITGIALLTLLFMVIASEGPEKFKNAATTPKTFQEFVSEVNALNSLVQELAAERFAINSGKGEIVIMTLHQGLRCRKLTDGRVVIISLPVPVDTESIAAARYVYHHNVLVRDSVDAQAKEGKHKEALAMCQLLQHFDAAASMKSELERRIAILKALVKGEDTEKNGKALTTLFKSHEAPFGFSEIEKVKPTFVSNLFELTEIKD